MADTTKVPDAISKLMQGYGQQNTGPKNDLGKDDFLKLLLTELKYQDPTEAKNDKDFIAQLAQFSSLEQTTKLADNMGANLEFQQLSQAATLVGKTVTVNEFVNGKNKSGVAEEIHMVDNKPKVLVGGKLYDMTEILGVAETKATAEANTTAAAGSGAQAQG